MDAEYFTFTGHFSMKIAVTNEGRWPAVPLAAVVAQRHARHAHKLSYPV